MSTKIKGLSGEEVRKSFQLHGDNSLKKEKSKSFLKRFIENLSDPIIRILLIALVLQVLFTFENPDYLEIGGILLAILLSTTVSTVSEYQSEKAFEKINGTDGDGEVSVLRDGRIQRIRSSELVIGDVVYLSAGEKIQADGELITGRINVDQSALNGESQDYVKQPAKANSWELDEEGRVYRGTMITSGSAVMRVLRVGAETYYGLIAKEVQTETRVSPLKLRLGRLAGQISKIGYLVAVIVGLSYLFNAIIIENHFEIPKILQYLSDPIMIIGCLIRAFTLMITVVVVAAPEGLPMMITVVLSANMKRMLSDNILVKKLVGIETAGSMNILFTDKTGTLTVGRPLCESFITQEGSCKGITALRRWGEIYELLSICAKYNTDVLCTDGNVTGGNATDRAIFEFFAEESVPDLKVLERSSFTSEKKTSSVKLSNGITIIKGAAELILKNCKYSISQKGKKIPFDPSYFRESYYQAAAKGERIIGVALDDGTGALSFVSLITMKDKVREGVHAAIKQVIDAGIQIVMITGDGKETASAIAEECGILNKRAGHIVISSSELKGMTDREIKALLPKIRVVSRALPQDKSRLVRLSQELDLVVGMTGDGINDAPSLKLSDIGFAMGSGTDIAKSASDIVILDNSFLAISKAILYGRTIFKSIRKFITFQLTMNLTACGVSLMGQFIGVDTPITIIQMLWVNIIMDTLGGLAFAGEPPLSYYMQEKPKSREEPILNGEMLNQIFITGSYTLLMCIFFLASNGIRSSYGGLGEKFYTAFYALFIFSGIFNCFLARCPRLWLLSNLSKNKPFVLIMLLICIIQLCMIYFGGAIFRCTPLLPHELSFVVLLSSSVLPAEMMRRLFYKLK